jgi:hypothetical protein
MFRDPIYQQAGQIGQTGYNIFGSLGQQAGQFGQAGLQDFSSLGQAGLGVGDQGFQNFTGIAATAGQYPQFDNPTISSYMDPYHQQVIDARTGEAARDAAAQMADLKMAASQAGGFGGSRHGLMEQGVRRDLAREQDSIVNQGKRDAYMNALGLIQADRDQLGQVFDRRLGAQNLAEQASRYGLDTALGARAAGQDAGQWGYGSMLGAAGMGQESAQWGSGAQSQALRDELAARQMAQDNFWPAFQGQLSAIQGAEDIRQSGFAGQLAGYEQMGGLSSLLGGLGAQEQQLQMERLMAMDQAGQQQRALQQAGLDVGYQDYLRQMGYPQDQIGFMSTILQGLPYMGMDTSGTQSMTEQQPGLFQSILGTGIGGLGLYNAYNSNQ